MAGYLEEIRRAESAGAPTPASALNGLGDAFLDKGDIASAVDYYRQSAEAYEREGMYDNAIACCRKIRRHAPEDDRVALMLGRYFATKGLRFDAIEELGEHVGRLTRQGRRREAADALREILRIDPDRLQDRERLARLLADEGLRGEAEQEYRGLMDAYRDRNDLDGVQRVRTEVMGLHRPPDSAPAPDPRLSPPPPEGRAPLELEPTSIVEREPESAPEMDPAVPAPSGAADSARRLFGARHWAEAVHAFRLLSQQGGAQGEDFAAWAESARQAGEASQVLEALTAAARWRIGRGELTDARRAAEEMLLLDPDSTVATDILERVGTSLPRG